jgi:exodeoxyribonuclease VII large subunit
VIEQAPAFVFGVRQLTRYLKALVEHDRTLSDVWVRGEVSNCVRHSSGHIYFTLKDDASQLRCVIFRRTAEELPFLIADGQALVAHGAISVYEARGSYELIVTGVLADGVGALLAAFEALKRKLAAEGLFEPARKRPLPPFPRRIGVVTSPDGAVLHDIVTIIRRRWPATDLLLIPAQVSGAGAAPSIADALAAAGAIEGLDVVIVGRGGGSLEELAAFNDEGVARAIAACPIPVVSAVGHETDFTIADFVADLRAPTPSAAAELVVPDGRALAAQIADLGARAVYAVRSRVAGERRHLALLARSRPLSTPAVMLSDRRRRLDDLWDDACRALRMGIATRRQALGRVGALAAALDPRAILGRGYSVFRLPDGAVVRSVGQVSAGDRGEVLVADGAVEVAVSGARRRETEPPAETSIPE